MRAIQMIEEHTGCHPGRYFHFKSRAYPAWMARTSAGHDIEGLSFDFREICHLMQRGA
jgi:hypothetical protein